MNTRNLLASAAVAAVLGLSVPAHAQLLGGGATGGLGGTLSGGLRNVDVMGRGGVMGSIDADTSAVGGVRRTVKDTAGKAKEKTIDTAKDKTKDTVSSTDTKQSPVKAPTQDAPVAVSVGADANASAAKK